MALRSTQLRLSCCFIFQKRRLMYKNLYEVFKYLRNMLQNGPAIPKSIQAEDDPTQFLPSGYRLLFEVMCKYLSSENIEFLETLRNIHKHNMDPKRHGNSPQQRWTLNEKSLFLCSDCQSNAKTIRVLIKQGPSRGLVV